MSAKAELDAVAKEVEALAGLTLNPLRDVWRDRFDEEPPPIGSSDFLRRSIAERIQMEVEGSDPLLQRDLDRLARKQSTGQSLVPAGPRLKTGAILVREWRGETHRVEVTGDGYRWRGEHHRNLSAIASAITGTRWNGPKFFGLRGGVGK